jgi:hypothetical protein
MIRFDVVPRTMLSSTSTTDLPFRWAGIGLSLIRTAFSRSFWVGMMNVRPMYRFFIKDSTNGIFEPSAYPIAYAVPESGTEPTESAFTGSSS